MGKIIDPALIDQLDKAIELYAEDDVEMDIPRATVIALVSDYSSRLKDINLLIDNRRLSSCNVLMRVAFETDTYIRYIFEDNSKFETRAKAYFYHGFQKSAYYFAHLDATTIANPKELVQKINNSHDPKLLGHHNSLNEYFNDNRAKFRACFSIEDNKLNFETLGENEPFKPHQIDAWKWYNDDGNTHTFLDLIKRLRLIDEYAALYIPTSADVHSDTFPHNLEASQHALTVTQSFDPNMLVFFRASILEFLEIIRKHVHSNTNKRKIANLITKAKTIYLINHR